MEAFYIVSKKCAFEKVSISQNYNTEEVTGIKENGFYNLVDKSKEGQLGVTFTFLKF